MCSQNVVVVDISFFFNNKLLGYIEISEVLVVLFLVRVQLTFSLVVFSPMSLCLCLFLSFVLVCHRFLVCVFMLSSLCYHVIMSTSLHVSCFILFLCSVFSFILLLRCSCFLSIQTLHSFSHTPVQNRIHVTVFVVTVSSNLSLSLVLSQFFFLPWFVYSCCHPL